MAPSVRRSKAPLAALAIVVSALASAPARAQLQSLSDMQIGPAQTAQPESALPDLKNSDAANDDADQTLLRPPPPPGAKRPPPRKAGDLPPLQPYPVAARPGQRKDAKELRTTSSPDATEGVAPPGPTVAAPQLPPPRRKIAVDASPFDPVGLRIGAFDVKPYLEQDVGYASNPLGLVTSPKSSGMETTEAGVSWQSLGSHDDFHGQLKGGYTDYFETPESSGPYGSGIVDGRLDVTRDLAFDAEGRYTFAPEPLSNFGVGNTSGNNPFIQTATYGATLGAVQKFGDFSVGLHGSYDRQAYQDDALRGSSGPIDPSLSADDYSDWGLKLRTSYRVSEAVSPYVEVDVDTRRYDNGLDALGYQADSNGVSALVGVTLSFSQMLSGEVALGYGERTYQDPRLPHAQTPLVDASLIWVATPLTTLTIRAATALNDAILINASADINHTYSIDLAHALTRQWTLGLTGTYGTDTFVGSSQTDQNWTVGARAEYHVTRDLLVKLTATHNAYASNVPNSDSSGNTVLLGVRLQR